MTLAALAPAAHLTGRFENPALLPPANASPPEAAAHLRHPRGSCTDRGGPFGVPVARLAELAGFAYPRATLIKVARAAATTVWESVVAALGGAPVDEVVALTASRGIGVLWATHLVAEAERAHRVVVLDKGLVLFDGAAADLCRQQGQGSLEAAFLQLTGVRQ